MAEPISILHVIDQLTAGGAERMAVEIANATDKCRHRVSLCVTRNNLTMAPFLNPGTTVFSLERKHRFSWTAYTRFSEFMRKNNVRILHIHGLSSFMFIVAGRAIGKIPSSTALVVHDHNGNIETVPRLNWSYRIALRLLQPVYVGVHPDLVELAVKSGLAADRAHLIRNAINFDRQPISDPVNTLAAFRQKGPVGILLSNVRPAKNVRFFIRAAARLKHRPWTIVVLGSLTDENYVEKCRRDVHHFGLKDRIHFLGSRLDVMEMLKQADFGVFSSETESGPLALLEYMAAGVPFISTRVGLVGRYAAKEGIQEFVESSDEEGFAQAMERLLMLSPEAKRRRGMEGRIKAQAYFDMCRVIPEWYRIYHQALGLAA